MSQPPLPLFSPPYTKDDFSFADGLGNIVFGGNHVPERYPEGAKIATGAEGEQVTVDKKE